LTEVLYRAQIIHFPHFRIEIAAAPGSDAPVRLSFKPLSPRRTVI